MSDRIQAFDASVNAISALLWQHDNAPRLKALVSLKAAWYRRNHTAFWNDWIRDVFDIRTANEFGLAVWGRILGVSLGVTVESSKDKDAFGFGVNHQNFGHGNFARATAGEQVLTLEQKRLVIRLRYMQLISRGTIPEVNAFMAELFGDQGTVWVKDSYDMSFVTYFFGFEVDSGTRFILDKYDLLPRPAGVGARYRIQPRPSFGFGPDHLNFENGNFGA